MARINSETSAADNPGEAHDEARVLVTLMVGDQLCGVPVLAVRDVLGPQKITPIPLTPPEIAGGLNLRGRIVTAVDLRVRLDLPPPPPEAKRMSIVTEIGNELYALLVDSVSEVLSPAQSCFEQNPPTLPKAWAAYSDGVYRLEEKLLVVLDVRRLLALRSEQV